GSKVHDYRISLFLCSEVSHFVLESKKPNKAFKSDSQRLAFSIQGWISCLWRNGLGLVAALLTP
ncbi:hypothetical protein P3656_23305, partial [Vibrio parahaemolyticus]|uniref:hypothetical protein n=1 Tax=Vibrio parahaemolyticus TaxID=670 RepID=UPI001BAF4811